MTWFLLILRKLPLSLYAIGFLLVTAVYQWHRADGLRQDIEDMRVQALEDSSRLEADNRSIENAANAKARDLVDSLAKAQAGRAAERSAAEQRLRELAERYTQGDSSEAAAAARRCHDLPAAAVVHEQTRGDLVALTDGADAVAKRLSALQQYVNEQCKPGASSGLPQ